MPDNHETWTGSPKYHDGMPEMVIGHYVNKITGLGRSDVEIAAFLGVSIQTFHKWLHDKPAFKEAVEIGRTMREAATTDLLAAKSINNEKFNTQYMIFHRKNVDKWSDAIRIDGDIDKAADSKTFLERVKSAAKSKKEGT